MGNICYYLTCSSCCIKHLDIDPKKKEKNLKTINKISRNKLNLRRMSSGVDPTLNDIRQQTVICKLPNKQFRDETHFIRGHGFRIERFIAGGASGKVYEGLHTETGLKLAVKTIVLPKGKDESLKNIQYELYTLQRTKHPHLIKMVANFILEKNNEMVLYLFQQLATNGSLNKRMSDIATYQEGLCCIWFAQLLSAMNFLHNKGIAHRNLKLDNILLDENADILVSDFGLSRIVWQPRAGGLIETQSYAGTGPYLSPEVLAIREYKSESPYNAFYADVWALGVILYRLFTKCYPFDKHNPKNAMRCMSLKEYSYPVDCPEVPELKAIIRDIFEYKPSKRPTMAQLTEYEWVAHTYQMVERENNRLMEGVI